MHIERPYYGALCAGLALVTVACQNADNAGDTPAMETEASIPGVRIAAPADGAEVSGPSVDLVLEVTGVRIVAAGTDEPDTGHHHIFVDRDVTPVGQPIPAGEDGIIHLGDASTTYTLQDLAPGEHRVIAVLGDHVHTRMPVATDTVRFTVP